jgi:hypothetical protein
MAAAPLSSARRLLRALSLSGPAPLLRTTNSAPGIDFRNTCSGPTHPEPANLQEELGIELEPWPISRTTTRTIPNEFGEEHGLIEGEEEEETLRVQYQQILRRRFTSPNQAAGRSPSPALSISSSHSRSSSFGSDCSEIDELSKPPRIVGGAGRPRHQRKASRKVESDAVWRQFWD